MLAAVAGTEAYNGLFDLCLLGGPFRIFPLPELLMDLAVQLIHVGLVDSAANLRQALFQPRLLLGVGLLNSLLIGVKGFDNLLQRLIGDMNILQNLPQAISKILFTEIRKVTFSPVARAMVIGIFAPLNFRRDGTAVVSALQQVPERKFTTPVLGPITICQHGLPHAGKGIPAHCIECEYPACYGRFLGIDLDGSLQFIIPVAQRWPTRINSLFRLFPHSLVYFFPKVLDVVAGHHNVDTVHKLCLRFGVPADYLSFLRQMNLNVQILQLYIVPEISIQTICFFGDHHAAVSIILQEPRHLPELLASCDLGRFYVGEFANDLKIVRGRIFPEQL